MPSVHTKVETKLCWVLDESGINAIQKRIRGCRVYIDDSRNKTRTLYGIKMFEGTKVASEISDLMIKNNGKPPKGLPIHTAVKIKAKLKKDGVIK